ncbi:MAG: 50S ribosomal protein L24 [Vallitaleaceae bacterium]|nr:50S ribosomal protein L24 [Vallitaleaceae bacterium]
MGNLKIKTGDTVLVTTGKDKGKQGKVMSVDMKNKRVLVEGVAMATKHTKPSAANKQGGIIHQEAMIDVSNVMYIHKGKPTRLGIQVSEETRDGKVKAVRKRVAKSTGEVID